MLDFDVYIWYISSEANIRSGLRGRVIIMHCEESKKITTTVEKELLLLAEFYLKNNRHCIIELRNKNFSFSSVEKLMNIEKQKDEIIINFENSSLNFAEASIVQNNADSYEFCYPNGLIVSLIFL